MFLDGVSTAMVPLDGVGVVALPSERGLLMYPYLPWLLYYFQRGWVIGEGAFALAAD